MRDEVALWRAQRKLRSLSLEGKVRALLAQRSPRRFGLEIHTIEAPNLMRAGGTPDGSRWYRGAGPPVPDAQRFVAPRRGDG